MNSLLKELKVKKVHFIQDNIDLIKLINYKMIHEYQDNIIIVDNLKIEGLNLKIIKLEEDCIEIMGVIESFKVIKN